MRAIVALLLCQASRECTVQRMLFSVLLKESTCPVLCRTGALWLSVLQALGCMQPWWYHSEGSWDNGCGGDSGYGWEMKPKDLNDLLSGYYSTWPGCSFAFIPDSGVTEKLKHLILSPRYVWSTGKPIVLHFCYLCEFLTPLICPVFCPAYFKKCTSTKAI